MNPEKWYENEEAFFKDAFSVSDKTISEWQKRGFSLGEATEWSTWGISPAKASQYISDGMKVVPDVRFKYSEIGIRKAFEWEKAGFNYGSAIEWSECGVNSETAKVLREKGVSADDISDYLFFEIPLNKALKWLEAGFSALTAIFWTDWNVSCERALKYFEEGIHEPPDEQFREAGLSLAEALKWSKADIDFDTASDWIYWEVPTDKAIELVQKDVCPPGEEFKELGLTYLKAMEWLADFSEDVIEYSDSQIKTYWRPWFGAGFSVQSAREFQSELVEFVKNAVEDGLLARNKPFNYTLFKEEDKEVHCKLLLDECVDSISHLHETGMKLTVENVMTWRAMSSSQILACVDKGIDANEGYRLGDSVLSEHQVEIYSLVKENGFRTFPGMFIRLGLTITDLQKLIKLKVDVDDFVNVCFLLKINGAELLKWATVFKNLATKIEITRNLHQKAFIAEWINSNFNPKEAWDWYEQGFNAGQAKEWVDSGVTDPAVATRRKNAGLKPK